MVEVRSLWLVISHHDIRSKWSCYHLFLYHGNPRPTAM